MAALMVQPAENWCRENAPDGLNSPRYWRICIQREMCPHAIVSHIKKEHVAQAVLLEDDDMELQRDGDAAALQCALTRSDCDLPADFDDAVARKSEEIADVHGVSLHRGEESLLPFG
jgi:hypothetical protein